ncbi:MAG TPA: hypothetical protein VGR53_00685 [Nitrososphaerales archaeon]|nr:hypothetical protein [Nitrososphaerales archaeon]
MSAEEKSDVVSEVEWFLDRVRKTELIITDTAQSISWVDLTQSEDAKEGGLWGRRRRNLGECFALAWRDYDRHKGDPESRLGYAQTVQYYMAQLYAHNCITEGNGLLRKLSDAESKNDELTRHNELLASELKQLQEEKKNFWKSKKKMQKDMK